MKEEAPIIKPEELLLLKQSTPIVIVDARSGADAKDRYAAAHIDGALHVDLDKDLSNVKPDPADGGRHPLPDFIQFSKVLTRLGITPHTHVVIYDDKNGANAASRFWWMLKSIGHKKVQVLDGGFDAAIKTGVPTSSKEEVPLKTEVYETSQWQLPLADINEVDRATQNDNYLIIDVREKDRFDGLREPIDSVAGHIPGAINIPLQGNLDADGFFKTPIVLKEQYSQVLQGKKAEHVIVHCGSGVTACHTLLAMAYAGMEIPKLYVGSWSEWSGRNRRMVTNTKD
ncbi:sulfurtransferase [Solitalea koreensis]|uniref:Thiosulfate/3-mercaptopyruvate sulfurtransferase n=1 Tax=Solitalea koreensis TaxID=543615 RepID=A0A521BQY3_9SPHI|nr:sulfurtransferase [Solitalea koreensis]SMO49577.1 thiosulfate/3-mercaptopyruvate sulfurtransferase [Solitalea koreensis]